MTEKLDVKSMSMEELEAEIERLKTDLPPRVMKKSGGSRKKKEPTITMNDYEKLKAQLMNASEEETSTS